MENNCVVIKIKQGMASAMISLFALMRWHWCRLDFWLVGWLGISGSYRRNSSDRR
ncbi:hypothetical protein D083_3499 [Dickeya solani RNS 08.23.3.1.A]|nr:hypothetical protein D083_3499 [Dickeya solani RNS 08.23.3.1.A]